MKPVRCVCLFLSFAATVSAQPDMVPRGTQPAAIVAPGAVPNRQRTARQLHQVIPHLPSVAQGHGFGQDRGKSTASPSGSSALDFAAVVTYNSGAPSFVGGSLPTASVVVADVNGDGKLDMVVPNYQNSTSA